MGAGRAVNDLCAVVVVELEAVPGPVELLVARPAIVVLAFDGAELFVGLLAAPTVEATFRAVVGAAVGALGDKVLGLAAPAPDAGTFKVEGLAPALVVVPEAGRGLAAVVPAAEVDKGLRAVVEAEVVVRAATEGLAAVGLAAAGAVAGLAAVFPAVVAVVDLVAEAKGLGLAAVAVDLETLEAKGFLSRAPAVADLPTAAEVNGFGLAVLSEDEEGLAATVCFFTASVVFFTGSAAGFLAAAPETVDLVLLGAALLAAAFLTSAAAGFLSSFAK